MTLSPRSLRKFTEKTTLALVWIPIIAIIFYITIPLGNTRADHFDALLVLGCPAASNGAPSPEQRTRVLEGVRQYKVGVAPVMIFSGGAAHNRFVEADVMAKLAESLGVPRRAIFEETQARDTIQNVEYSTAIMHAHGWDSVEAITTVYHVRRASLILMHAPFTVNWKMQAAPWPADYGFLDKATRYSHEIFLCAKMRILGFHEAAVPLPSGER